MLRIFAHIVIKLERCVPILQVNFAKGDTFGRNAYFSGVCQWLKKAKTFDATIAFCDQYPGWECDLYFYLSEPLDGIQMVRVEYGEVFSVSLAIGVAILPRGTDFLHQDFRTQIGVQQWLSEGSKIGYTSKLDVKALGGSVNNPSSIKDEPRPKPRLSVTAPVVSNTPRSVNNEMKKCVYLDYNGTTTIYPPVLEAMLPYFTEHFGNPSSSHGYGQEPKRAVDKARRSLLRVIQHSPDDDADASCIVFTGCGSHLYTKLMRMD